MNNNSIPATTPYKYIISPGFVESISDGQRHYIGAMKLIKLYNVNPRDCFIYEPTPQWTESQYRLAHKLFEILPNLTPRKDGNYGNPQNYLRNQD